MYGPAKFTKFVASESADPAPVKAGFSCVCEVIRTHEQARSMPGGHVRYKCRVVTGSVVPLGRSRKGEGVPSGCHRGPINASLVRRHVDADDPPGRYRIFKVIVDRPTLVSPIAVIYVPPSISVSGRWASCDNPNTTYRRLTGVVRTGDKPISGSWTSANIYNGYPPHVVPDSDTQQSPIFERFKSQSTRTVTKMPERALWMFAAAFGFSGTFRKRKKPSHDSISFSQFPSCSPLQAVRSLLLIKGGCTTNYDPT